MNIIKPIFWNKKNILSLSLYPLTCFIYIINLIKNFSHKKKFSLKSICVGNIYLGGTGKTALSIKINKILKKNYKTTFIKKKYDNQYDEQNLLKSNGIEIAGIEYIKSKDRTHYTYDINTNTNYNSIAERENNSKGMDSIAAFLYDELKK